MADTPKQQMKYRQTGEPFESLHHTKPFEVKNQYMSLILPQKVKPTQKHGYQYQSKTIMAPKEEVNK